MVRKIVFLTVMVMSVTAMVFFFMAIFGAFTSEEMIRNWYWIKGTANIKIGQPTFNDKQFWTAQQYGFIGEQMASDLTLRHKKMIEKRGQPNNIQQDLDYGKCILHLFKDDHTSQCPAEVSNLPNQPCTNVVDKETKKNGCEYGQKLWKNNGYKLPPDEGGNMKITYYMVPWGRVAEFEFQNLSVEMINYIKDAMQKQIEIEANSNREEKARNYVSEDVDPPDWEATDKLVFAAWAGQTCIVSGPVTGWCEIGDEKLQLFFWLCMLGMLAQLTAAMADCQRWTEYGDFNCQKFNGFISAILSCLSAFGAYATFMSLVNRLNNKAENKHHAFIPIASTSYGWEIWSGEPEVEYTFIATLILISGFLKIPDILAHCLISTPKGRHHKPDDMNPVQDLVDYLLRYRDANEPELPYSATH